MTHTNAPLVTIVTPSYGQAKFIRRTLESVRAQTYPHIEHIVVDGGSKDGTLEILREQERAPGFQWFSEPDEGMYDAINKGLRLSRGEILAYLNTDDILMPWAVEEAVSCFQSDKELDLVYADQVLIREDGRFQFDMQPPYRPALMRRTGWSLPQPTVFWHRRLYERFGGFDPSLKFAGDLEYWLRVGRDAKVRQVREIFAGAQLHALQKTQAGRPQLVREMETVLARYTRAGERSALLKAVELRGYAWWAVRLVTAKFVFAYARKMARPAEGPWSRFLSVPRLHPHSNTDWARGFLPWGHRGGFRWLFEGVTADDILCRES